MSSFFVLCHVPSRVWVSKLCKRLVLCFTLHVLHILLCPSSQLCYRFSIYVTVLRISHVSRYKSNIRFGYLYSNHNFVSINYVLEYLLSHPYDLLCMFYDCRNSFYSSWRRREPAAVISIAVSSVQTLGSIS